MDWLSDGVMFAWYASTLGVLGATSAVRVLTVPSRSGASVSDGWPARALRVARLCMPVVLLTLVLRLWLQTWQAFGTDQSLSLATVIISDTPWGVGWAWQATGSALAWTLLAVGSARRWSWLLLAGFATGGTVGLTGHAAGAASYASLLIVVHGLHVIAAGMWLGTLAVILSVTRVRAASAHAPAQEAVACVIDRFSPQAVVSVAVLVSSGLMAAWQHVNSVNGLLTPYGFVLIAKVTAFGAAGLCGLYNWRVVRPSLATHPEGPAQLRRMAFLELTLGLAALMLTSALTSMPMPEHP